MVEKEISPASIPQRVLSWSETIKPINTEVNDNVIIFQNQGGFRFCRTEESFTEGIHRCELSIDFKENNNKVISFGICWEKDLICEKLTYYFPNTYMYCSYFPSFSKDSYNISTEIPLKHLEENPIAINIDFDNKNIFWEINGENSDKFNLETDGNPVYFIIGIFGGEVTLH